MARTAANRDIIVIGASTGGIDALRVLVGDLPEDLPAAVFVVMHVGATSHLAAILDRVSTLPVVKAENGAPIAHGRIYIAVPGRHLLLHDNHILLRRGPRENHARPAIDPLFRSAAASFGGRVIGVVLSGALSDGTAGLRAIKRCNGLAVVQDPQDADMPEMPQNALRHAEVDHVVPMQAMGALLSKLTRQEAAPRPEVPLDIRLEAAIAAQELAGMKMEDMLGKPSRFTCPECHGTLWEIEDGSLLRYRCHVGHAFSADAVQAAQGEEIDRLLGTLLRAQQERAGLARRMAEHERQSGRTSLADQLARRASEYDDGAQVLRSLIRNGEANGEVLTKAQQQGVSQDEQEA
jgi:two-component system chemotaxis response regulator CheB